jgi:hypothetical protein
LQDLRLIRLLSLLRGRRSHLSKETNIKLIRMRYHQEWLPLSEEVPSRTHPDHSNMALQTTTLARLPSSTITIKISSSNRTTTLVLTLWVLHLQISFVPSRLYLLPLKTVNSRFSKSRSNLTLQRLRPTNSTRLPRFKHSSRSRPKQSMKHFWLRSRLNCRNKQMQLQMRNVPRTRDSTERR